MKLNFKLAVKIILLVAVIAFTLFPIYWLIIATFKTDFEINMYQTYLPDRGTLEQWAEVLDPGDVWLPTFQNSVVVSSITTGLCLLIGFPAAYAFSRASFMGKDHLFFWLLSNRMAPGASFIVPYFAMYTSIGLFDSVWAVILTHTLFNLPLGIWIMKGYVDDIPNSIDQQAAIDGHSLAGFFRRIFIPQMAAGIGVSAFFMFSSAMAIVATGGSLLTNALMPRAVGIWIPC